MIRVMNMVSLVHLLVVVKVNMAMYAAFPGMFPLILAVLNRDYSRGYYSPY